MREGCSDPLMSRKGRAEAVRDRLKLNLEVRDGKEYGPTYVKTVELLVFRTKKYGTLGE